MAIIEDPADTVRLFGKTRNVGQCYRERVTITQAREGAPEKTKKEAEMRRRRLKEVFEGRDEGEERERARLKKEVGWFPANVTNVT